MKQQEQPDMKNILQMLQKKIGNLELTVHAMMNVLEKEDLMNQDRINEEAEEIVKKMQEIPDEDVEKEVEERLQN